MNDYRRHTRRAVAHAARRLGRTAAGLGDIALDDLLPPEFQPDRLDEQIRQQVRDREGELRRAARSLLATAPDQPPAERLARLFGPLRRHANGLRAGRAALEMVPAAILVEGAAELQLARSLLGAQIDVVALALFVTRPESLTEEVAQTAVELLDEVYGLDELREDLRSRDLADRLRRAGAKEVAWGAARLVLRGLTGWLQAGQSVAETAGRYARLDELEQAALRRIGS